MNYRVTAILLAVLIFVAAYVYATELREKPPGAAPADPTKTAEQARLEVWRFDEKETKSITIDRGDVQTVVTRVDESAWNLEQPFEGPADRTRINSFLFRLSTLNGTRRIADSPTNLSQYGLDGPRYVVTITQKDDIKYHLVVGARGPAESGTYVKRADEDAVLLITNQFVNDIERMITEPPKEPPTPTPAPTSTSTPTPEPGAEATATPSS